MKAKHKEPRIFSFPPSVSWEPEFLILGSMPGEESLRQQQYYAHPRNLFWKIMGTLLNFDHTKTPYAERLKILSDNKIALWDVTHSCVRKGSMDSDIKEAHMNDFDAFFAAHASIRKVLCNGKTSFRIFSGYAASRGLSVAIVPLPSTSPAFASLTFEQKLAEWRAAFR